MNNELYTNIGFIVVWCVKYIFIPLGVAISARIFVDKLLHPQPDRQRKKRSNKNRLNNNSDLNLTATSVAVLIYIITL